MIYCLEDDDSIRELIVYTLKSTGFEAQGFSDNALFFNALEKCIPDLIILDIMLPDEDGISVLKKLKIEKQTRDIPVIMATAKTAEYNKVQGLDSGADDYITKPFGMMELVSRIKAVLRRVQKKPIEDEITIGNVTLNNKKHLVLVGEQEVILTFKEFELLNCLMNNSGLVFTRDKLLIDIWGYDYCGETRTVDVHIRTLRQKLGEAGDIIETIRGVGYRVREP
ncbi:response regulator transcription factor [Selenomonadales bacterium OttesenSCG-928-I06]|nr:response regulator transcription factor [Selenomonadales bacterium OttesenSCG-928-I06]